MDRLTIELVLPESGAKIILYQHLTGGQYRDIQKGLFKDIKVNVSNVKGDKEEAGKAISKELLKEIPASLLFEQSELTLLFLIKEIFDKDNLKVEDVKSFVYNLSQKDSDTLYNKVDELEASSTLSEEVKKK